MPKQVDKIPELSIKKGMVYSGVPGRVNVVYSIVPTPGKVTAKFEGKVCRCGRCNSVLGEFTKADGEIKCKKK